MCITTLHERKSHTFGGKELYKYFMLDRFIGEKSQLYSDCELYGSLQLITFNLSSMKSLA